MKSHIHITEPIIRMVHALSAAFDNEIIFCGSFGLVYNGVLDRPIGDIDVMTMHDYYHGGWDKDSALEREEGSSGTFQIGDHIVVCFKLWLKGDTDAPSADIFYAHDNYMPSYDVVDFHGVKIKIEKPEGAIVAKKRYVASPQLKNRNKHKSDLNNMSVESMDDLPF